MALPGKGQGVTPPKQDPVFAVTVVSFSCWEIAGPRRIMGTTMV